MRVLVTGAAGFIGSHLTDRLLAEGHTVYGADNMETGSPGNINPDAKVARVDIAKCDDLAELFAEAEPDAVAHCAASYADRTNWRRDTQTNVLGTVNVCKLAAAFDVGRIVYFQTALCYGHHPERLVEVTGYNAPKRQFLRIDPPLATTQPIAPDNSYAITKTAGEQFIQHSGLPYVSLRLANVYGPRNLSGPIPTFFKRISEGRICTVVEGARRDYVYIDDLLQVAVPAVFGQGRGVYHVASGSDFSIERAFVAVANAMGESDAPMRLIPRAPDDAESILLDPLETEREFNWKASTPFEDGIAAAVEWYAEHGVEQTFTHLSYAD